MVGNLNENYDYNTEKEERRKTMTTAERERDDKLIQDYNVAIQLVIAGRELINASRSSAFDGNKVEREKVDEGLKFLGFKSRDDFYNWNLKMTTLEALRCFRIVVPCDGCPGRPIGCSSYCKADSFYYNGEERVVKISPVSAHMEMRSTIDLTQAIDAMETFQKHGSYLLWRKFPNNCAPTCSIRRKKLAEPKMDLDWRIPYMTEERFLQEQPKWEVFRDSYKTQS